MRYGAPWVTGALVYGDADLGVLGSVIRATTGTGPNGAGILYNDWDSSADDSKLFRALVLSGAPAGAFFYEDGSFSIPAGTADGTYSVSYRLFVDGADLGTSTATITVGSASLFTVAPTGIASTLALGNAAFTAQREFNLAPAGLPSTLAFGDATVSFEQGTTFTLSPAGLASTLAFGAATVAFTIPDTGEPVTVPEVKLAARIDGDELDPMLLALIAAARERAEHITRRAYRRATTRITRRDWPAVSDALHINGATACAIQYWDGAAWVVLDPALYLFAPGGIGDNGTVLAPALGQAWPALGDLPVGPRVRIDLTAGPASRDDVPEQVKLYIKASVAAWVKNPEALASGNLAPHPLFERLLDAERLYS